MNKIDEIMLPRVTKVLVSACIWWAIASLGITFLGFNKETTYGLVCGYMFISIWNNIFYMLYRMIKG